MASGPAEAAESSKMAGNAATTPQQAVNASSFTPGPYMTRNQNPYASLATQMSSPVLQQSYQTYWQTTWPMDSLYSGGASAVPQTAHYSQPTYAHHQAQYYSRPGQTAAGASKNFTPPVSDASVPRDHAVKAEIDERVPVSPSPPPLLPDCSHWDEAVRVFLRDAGLVQALRGFEGDMVVMNDEWERKMIPLALKKLIKELSGTRELMSSEGKEQGLLSVEESPEIHAKVDRSLDDRKLDYVKLANGAKAHTPTSINKEISGFLAKNRARNDSSNRTEFLLSLAEKRRLLQEEGGGTEDGVTSSCARTDARTVDRAAQMKYDIAKNDDGPLRRTKAKKSESQQSASQQQGVTRLGDEVVLPGHEDALPKRHPGADERLSNIEAHLAVRYVPLSPRTLWSRLKFLEDHIIRLEKDYPPWAALHFNQPNRGWPPPPRQTPIIVPPHLRCSEVDGNPSSIKATISRSQPSQVGLTSTPSVTLDGGSKFRNTKSSLQKAVLERLEVKQAMGENADFGG